ncbi:MAG: oligosaccharide flippase family protein [Clostridiales bacterium]|jgi:O-antigen/teichoic acid export membrane protein|nr:oligosaccharide flippase family protein [Clostridiales bacterium]
MNKYKKLVANTAIFGISTFSSKVLVFLLMPLYTSVLSQGEYGVIGLMVQAGNLIIPFVTLGVINAIIRFGLDAREDKDNVFSTAIYTTTICFAIFCLTLPVWRHISAPPFGYISPYIVYVYIFVFTSAMRSICAQFVRSKQHIKLYAIDGIISTITTIAFTVWFLVGLKMGIVGYVLAIICSDACSVIFLFIAAKLHKNLTLNLDIKASKQMILYAIPLISTTVCWWITTASDHFMVAGFCGDAMNGLYEVSYKVPTVIILISGIFMDAWQVSAVTEEEETPDFFTKVFGVYQTVIFIGAALLIAFAKLATKILVSDAFYPAWQFMPLLICATVFSCMLTFFGTIYMLKKRSVASMVTMVIGAAANVILNLILIPKWGANGAALATFISYFIIFAMRAFDTKRLLKFKWSLTKILVNTCILVLQTVIMILELKNWMIYEAICVLAMILLNFKNLLGIKNILKLKLPSR